MLTFETLINATEETANIIFKNILSHRKILSNESGARFCDWNEKAEFCTNLDSQYEKSVFVWGDT